MTMSGNEEILISERNFDSIFSYTAGTVRSKFLTQIRDNKKIVGTKCHRCNIVWVPARSSCAKCFESLKEYVEVADTGTVTTYTVINSYQPFYAMKPPFVLAVIQLDGADTGLVHFVGDVNPEDMKVGMRVGAVFNEERKGSVLDIKHFRPL